MALDKGELRYVFAVEDDFSSTTKLFKSELEASRRAFADFKASVADINQATSGAASAAKDLGKAQSDLAAATDRASGAAQDYTRELSLRERAEAKLLAILDKQALGAELQAVANEQGVALARTKIAALTDQERAEAKIEQALTKVRVAELARQIAERDGITVLEKKAVAFDAASEAADALTKAEQRLAVSQKSAGDQRLTSLRAEEQALSRVQQAETRRQSAALLNAQGRTPSGDLTAETQDHDAHVRDFAEREKVLADQATEAKKRATAATKALRDEEDQATESSGRLGASFLNLIGIFATFSAARLIFQGFSDLVTSGIAFNKTLEETRLGIASLIVAEGVVADAQGNTVTGAKALTIAQGEAARQTDLLQAAAQRTSVTFAGLAETFQTAVGPGLTAGLNLDQIREFTVLASQAGTALGLEERLFTTSLRNILTGSIQNKNALASALGITAADIQQAKDAGTLFDLLQAKFSAFKSSGVEAAKTFEGLFKGLKDDFAQLTGAAALGFFESLKGLLRDIASVVVTIGKDGIVKPNPEALLFLKNFNDGLNAAVQGARSLVKTLSIEDLAQTAKLAGDGLAFLVVSLGGVIQGVLRGVADVSAVIETIAASLLGVQGKRIFTEDFAQILSIVTEIFVVYQATQILAGLITLTIEAATAAYIVFDAAMTAGIAALSITYGLLSLQILPGLLIIGIVVAAVFGYFVLVAAVLKEWASTLTGINVTLGSALKILTVDIALGFLKAFSEVEHAAVELKAVLLDIAFSVGESLLKAFTGAVQTVLKSLPQTAAVKALLADNNAALETGVALINQQRVAQSKLLSDKLTAIETEQAANTSVAKGLEQQLAKGDSTLAQTVGEGLKAALDAIQPIFRDLLKGAGIDFSSQSLGIDKVAAEAKKLKDETAALPGLISASAVNMEHLTEIHKKLLEDLKNSKKSLDEGLVTLGLQGAILSERKLLFEGANKALEDGRQLAAAQVQEEAILLAIKKQQAAIPDQQASPGADKTALAEKAAQLAGQENAAQIQIKSIQEERLKLEGRINEATANRVQLIAVQESKRLEDANSLLLIQARAGARQAAAQADPSQSRIDTSTAASDLAKQQLVLNDQRRADEQKALEFTVQAASTTKERIALEKQLGDELKNNNLTREIELQNLAKVQKEEQKVRDIASAPIKVAAIEEFSKFQDTSVQAFEGTKKILEDSVNGLANVISTAIVDAFDPNKKVDIVSRFASLLQSIGQQILQLLTKIAIEKAVVAAIKIGGEALGFFAEGGSVPAGAGFAASPAHFQPGVQSFAVGGRPRGLPASDTVPAWLTPGEFVMRLSAVKRYGAEVMSAINSGVIDPRGLSALAGAGGRPIQVTAPVGPGYAGGGLISDGASNRVASTQTQPGGSGSDPVRAYVVADEQSFDRQIAGGKQSLLRFFRENRGTINGVLR